MKHLWSEYIHCIAEHTFLHSIRITVGFLSYKAFHRNILCIESHEADKITHEKHFKSSWMQFSLSQLSQLWNIFRYMLTQPDRYDVALLHLDRPVFYQDNIIPICLPPSDIHLTGKVGLVAGWGKTDNSFGKTGTNILHKVLVPIIKNDECIRWHEDKNILVQVTSFTSVCN